MTMPIHFANCAASEAETGRRNRKRQRKMRVLGRHHGRGLKKNEGWFEGDNKIHFQQGASRTAAVVQYDL